MRLNQIGDNITGVSNFSLYDRPDILTEKVSKELNTYRNWNLFGLQVEPLLVSEGGDGTDSRIWWNMSNGRQFIGTKSLFNNVHAVVYNDDSETTALQRVYNNAPLLDSQIIRAMVRERGGCSIKDLVEASENGSMGRAIYNYSDFMYCKFLGQISNNYMITLRRFPFPCGDHINFSSTDIYADDINQTINSNEYKTNYHVPDQGRLITWMGTPGNNIEDILKYSVLMPYEELSAEKQDLNGTAEDGGILGSIMNMTNPKYVDATMKGFAGDSAISMMQTMLGNSFASKIIAAPRNTEWAYHKDRTKPCGPVDVISKTHVRKGGGSGGLEFEQNFNLTFDYELRSYDGINTRAAFLDLISNILVVTYTNGKFWGGGLRNMGMSQSSVFTNLPIYKINSKMDHNQIKDAVFQSITNITTAMNNGQNPSSGFNGLNFEQPISKVKEAVANKDVTPLKEIDWSNPIEAMKNIGSGFLSMIRNFSSNLGNIFMGGALNALGRPQKQGLDSLLSSNPVGLWHVTVGNPKHPIMTMGNMILTSVEIQQYGPLGLDDFPTGVRVTVGLKHAMPRDRTKIEQMYMLGDSRIYMPMGKDIQLMYENATEMKPYSVESSDIDNAKAGVGTSSGQTKVESTSEAVESNKDLDRLYMKYFGTVDRRLIEMNAKEAHLGSSKAKSTAQSNAERARWEQQEKDAKQADENMTV